MNKQTPFYNVIIGFLLMCILGSILIVLKYFYKRKKMNLQNHQNQQTLLETLNQKSSEQLDKFVKQVIQANISYFCQQQDFINSQDAKDQNLKKVLQILAYKTKPKKSNQNDNQVKKQQSISFTNNQQNNQAKQQVKENTFISKQNQRVIKQLKLLCSKISKQEYSNLRQSIQNKIKNKDNKQIKTKSKQFKNKLLHQQPNKTIIISFIQKFTLIGAFINKDKKYLLKELFILSMFTVGILKINHIQLWPLGLSIFGLIVTFVFYEYLFKTDWTCFEAFTASKKKHQIHSGIQISSELKDNSFKSRIRQIDAKKHLQNLQIFQQIEIQNNQPIYPPSSISNSQNHLNLNFQILQDTNSRVFKPINKNEPQKFQVDDIVAVTDRQKNSNLKNKTHRMRLSPVRPKNILKQTNFNVQSQLKQEKRQFSQKKIQQINNDKQKQTTTIQLVELDTLNPQKELEIKKSRFETISISILTIITLIMFAQSMFTIFNSLSNLGPLNLASCVLMILIDQFCIRSFIFLCIFSVSQIIDKTEILSLSQNKFISQIICGGYLAEKFKAQYDQQIFKEMLKIKLGQLYGKKIKQIQYDNPDAQMTVSPTKKKGNSPSKIPKANKRSKQNQDESGLNLLQLQRGCLSKKSKSKGGRTQKRQNVLGQCNQDQQIEQFDMSNNKKDKNFHSLSAQRPIKNAQSILNVHNFNDDLVLVDNILNYIDERDDTQNSRKFKDFTIDIDFSPSKHVKNRQNRNRKKRRQLVITGSSPYLQYLPDMMKKVDRVAQKHNSNIKNQNSQYGNLVKKSQIDDTFNLHQSKNKESLGNFQISSRIL